MLLCLLLDQSNWLIIPSWKEVMKWHMSHLKVCCNHLTRYCYISSGIITISNTFNALILKKNFFERKQPSYHPMIINQSGWITTSSTPYTVMSTPPKQHKNTRFFSLRFQVWSITTFSSTNIVLHVSHRCSVLNFHDILKEN